jgi:DNA (cytosine-5)-methyltransferase 1
VFFVAVAGEIAIPADLIAECPSEAWHMRALVAAHARLSPDDRNKWLWWRLPVPPAHNRAFSDLIEDLPTGVRWHTPAETARLIAMMTPVNRAKLEIAKRARRRAVGGCLRTPRGGSSRQTIVVVQGEQVRTRLLSGREAARLMGLDDDYRLPSRYNDAYHVAGDGVCVPAVRHIAACLLEPILRSRGEEMRPLAAE